MDTSLPQRLLQRRRLDGCQSVTIYACSAKDARHVHYTVSAKFDCSAGFLEHSLCFAGETLRVPLAKAADEGAGALVCAACQIPSMV